MDIKPVAHRHLVSFGGKGRAWTAWITGETPVFGTPVMTEFAYPQSAIDALTAEVEALRKLCLEAVGRVSVTPDGGDLHDRLIAASMKGEG